ncbi:hypothetical protein A6A03_12945 [Chloroflexus islandicus]|uniref:Uncharacterized protein n=1 Tax=Chloroflexus islandicus TaxID=1707952 RepID=A0A178MBV4_9CHLR|nr:hypothetical protein [Chloroflexus islandicus]OAN46280.1 hypothetical protein A6A03_12945 [Chloroflexus islandicus]
MQPSLAAAAVAFYYTGQRRLHGWQICQERDARDNGFASNTLPAQAGAWLAAEQAVATLIGSQSRHLVGAAKLVNTLSRPDPTILLNSAEIPAVD